jgi:hypothetical protein
MEGLEPSGFVVEPTTVVRITKQMAKKIEMLSCHASQLEWMREHNRADDLVAMVGDLASDRGRLIGATAAEAFVQFLGHGYPSGDLLRVLLNDGARGVRPDATHNRARPRRRRFTGAARSADSTTDSSEMTHS